MATRDELKRAAAQRALEFVRDGMVLGLGSGSTAEICLRELAARVARGLQVLGVPTSRRTEELARQLGVPLTTLDEHPSLDLVIDGADEIDPRTFNLLKGRGGALLREKLVASAARERVIIADESKLVQTLGERQAVPVEIVRFGWRHTAASLAALGCQTTLRQVDGAPFVTDEGHYILDCRFGPIRAPGELAWRIKTLVGVVEHGIFAGLADRLVIGGAAGVQLYQR